MICLSSRRTLTSTSVKQSLASLVPSASSKRPTFFVHTDFSPSTFTSSSSSSLSVGLKLIKRSTKNNITKKVMQNNWGTYKTVKFTPFEKKLVKTDSYPLGYSPVQKHKSLSMPFGYNPIHDSLPKRLSAAEQVRIDVMDRWIPAARGNLKRMRSNCRLKRSGKSRRQWSRFAKPVYATRSQLNKLKKIVYQYVRPRRN